MVLRYERRAWVLFASLGSDSGRALLRGWGEQGGVPDSMVFCEGRCTYVRSDAVVRLARHLRAPWSWLRFLRVVPRSVRDAVYDAVAQRRMGWFGEAKTRCPVPEGELRRRFLP